MKIIRALVILILIAAVGGCEVAYNIPDPPAVLSGTGEIWGNINSFDTSVSVEKLIMAAQVHATAQVR